MTDKKLDRAFQRYREKGDVAALGEAFDLAAPELLRVARHLCRRMDEAEDVVQATFLTALSKAGDHDPSRRVLPWLLGILSLHAREARRRAGRTPDPDRLLERASRDPRSAAEDTELVDAVTAAVDQLPETYRGVLAAHLGRGLEPREVAREFGLSPVATRVRLHRGMKLLRRSLPTGFALGAAAAAEAASTGWPPPSGPVDPGSLAAMREAVLQAGEQLAREAGLLGTAAASAAVTSKLGSILGWGAGLVAAGTLVGTTMLWPENDRSRQRDRTVVREPAGTAMAPGRGSGLASERTLPEQRELSLPQERRGSSAEEPPTELCGTLVMADGGGPLAGARVIALDSSGTEVRARSAADGSFRLSCPGSPIGLSVEHTDHAPLRMDLRLGSRASREQLELGELPVHRGLSIVPELQDSAYGKSPLRHGRLLVAADFLDWIGLPGDLHVIGELGPELVLRSGVEPGLELSPVLALSAARYAKVSSFRPGECSQLLLGVARRADGTTALGWQELLVPERSSLPLEPELELLPTRELRLEVRGPDGLPVRDVVAAWAIPASLEPFAGTGEDGRPCLPSDLAPVLLADQLEAGMHVFQQLPWPGGADSPAETLRIGALDARGNRSELELAWGGDALLAEGPIVLELPGTDSPTRGVLRGRVLVSTPGDDRGALPREGIRVQLVAGGQDSGPYTETAPDGGFELRLPDGLQDSSLQLDLSLPDGSGRSVVAVSPRAEQQRTLFTYVVRSRAGTSTGSGARLAGSLRDGAGNPLPGVEIVLDDGRQERSTYTDPQGRFELQRGAGEHLLTALLGPELERLEPVLVQPGESVLDLVAGVATEGAARIDARIRGSSGTVDPAQACLVRLADSPEGTSRQLPFSRLHLGRGRVMVDAVPPGRWRLWVAGTTGEVGSVDVEVETGTILLPLVVELESTGSLFGQVLPAPLEGAAGEDSPLGPQLELRLAQAAPRGDDLGSATWAGHVHRKVIALAQDGSFEVEGLLPGRYRLRLGPAGVNGEWLVELQPGSILTGLELEARPSGRILVPRSELPEFGLARLEARDGDGRLWVGPLLDLGAEHGRELELRVPAGSLDWSVVFPGSVLPGSAAVQAPLGGEVLLQPGEVAVATPASAAGGPGGRSR